MTTLLIKLFIKDHENTGDEKVRTRYGTLSGFVGIAVNVILATAKMLIGSITKSIAITADGMNNLFDAISSVISLIGFKISGRPADKNHPFGYGRIEYVSALVLAFLIIHTGIDVVTDSIDKIKAPAPVDFSTVGVIVLVMAILMKVWLAFFNKKIGKAINSLTVDAVVADSIGDIAATTCSLIALIASSFTSVSLDAYMGLVVAAVIIYAGVGVIKDTMGPILGTPPEKDVVAKLSDIVLGTEGVVGIHDLVLHSYGVSKVMGSLHAEVPADVDIMNSHDVIDNLEQKIRRELGIEISIHMDPVLVNDERTGSLKAMAIEITKEINEKITIHDFRVVDGPTHTNIIFDAVLPYELKMSDDEFKASVGEKLKERTDKKYFAVITIDRSYV